MKKGKKNELALAGRQSYLDHNTLHELDSLIDNIINRYDIDYPQLLKVVENKIERDNDITVPVDLLQNRSLSIPEILIKYLSEERHLSVDEIAILLNRPVSGLKRLARSVEEKNIGPLFVPQHAILIPISLFSGHNLSYAETVVEFLKDNLRLKFSQISRIINRDNQTVWTYYHRAKTKRDVHDAR